MKRITVNNFGGGITSIVNHGSPGEMSSSRNFDVLSYPNSLFPLASMASATANTAIGNMIVGSDGYVYGVGTQSDNQSNGGLWHNSGGTTWTFLTSSGGSAGPHYNFLVEYKRYGTKNILFMNNGIMVAVDRAGNLSATAATFTPTYMGQGFVHPKDQILYVPYKISGTTVLGTMDATTWSPAIFTLPAQTTVNCLTNYGDYLAIPTTTYSNGVVPGSSVNTSVVYLWDRNTSNTLPNEAITWGEDALEVMNNLNGTLIGISAQQDDDNMTLLIKGYAGGGVFPIKEISIPKQTTTSPTIVINPRVNFIHRNRMYFSVDLKGGSTSPVQQGLWSVGKNKQGQWAVTVERFASTNGTDVSVIAAAFRLGYLHCVHTANGTLTTSDGLSSTLSTRFASASIHETCINPGMSDEDKPLKKQLRSFTINTLPLTSSGQIVVKYRVDSNTAWSSATTIFTKTSTSPDTNLVSCSAVKAGATEFTSGYGYEFRIESTGGAQVTSYTYKYEMLETNI